MPILAFNLKHSLINASVAEDCLNDMLPFLEHHKNNYVYGVLRWSQKSLYSYMYSIDTTQTEHNVRDSLVIRIN